MRRGMAVVALIIGCMGTTVSAVAEPATGEALRREAVWRLRPGDRVRLAGRGVGLREGRLARVSAAELRLEDGTVVPVDALDAVWRHGHAVKAGAITGGVALGVLGALTLGALGNAVCEYECEGQGLALGATGLAVGGAMGAGVGGLVGALIPKWHLLYRAPAPSQEARGERVTGTEPQPPAPALLPGPPAPRGTILQAALAAR
jgi:hypothetical protein